MWIHAGEVRGSQLRTRSPVAHLPQVVIALASLLIFPVAALLDLGPYI